MLSLSAHKFHGPKGVGVLYARRGIPLTNADRGRRAGARQARRHGKYRRHRRHGGGAGRGVRESRAKTRQNVTALRDKLIAGLRRPFRTRALNGDENEASARQRELLLRGHRGREPACSCWTRRASAPPPARACTSGSLDPSHVLLAIGRPHEVAHGSLRLTLCEENTEEEVDYMLQRDSRVLWTICRSMSPVWKDLTSAAKNSSCFEIKGGKTSWLLYSEKVMDHFTNPAQRRRDRRRGRRRRGRQRQMRRHHEDVSEDQGRRHRRT